jgi:hypothetical protein
MRDGVNGAPFGQLGTKYEPESIVNLVWTVSTNHFGAFDEEGMPGQNFSYEGFSDICYLFSKARAASFVRVWERF